MMWDLWWIGKTADNIVPFEYLKQHNLKIPKDRDILSKAKFVMNQIVGNESHLAIRSCSNNQRDEFFSTRFFALIQSCYRFN